VKNRNTPLWTDGEGGKMMDQLLQRMEQSDLEGVWGLIGEELSGKDRAWAIHLTLFPLVQRVLNPPFINPHLPKMYGIIREFLPYLEEDDIPPLVRLEITEYTRRPKSMGVVSPRRHASAVSFSQIEAAIGEREKERVAALMQAFQEQQGETELARRLLLLGSGYLDRSLGHSVSCTAFILLEMLARPDQDSWPALDTLADYFCQGRYHTTPELDGTADLPAEEDLERHLLRATSGYGIVNLHHTITRYAIERVRHLLSEAEYTHLINCWVEFLGAKSAEAPAVAINAEPVTDYDRFYRCFAKREEQAVLSSLAGLIRSKEGRQQLGRYLIRGVCDQYQGDYNPHCLTGLGSALWVVSRYHDRPPVVANALGQYLNYFFTETAS
jgi:hypothetical protein